MSAVAASLLAAALLTAAPQPASPRPVRVERHLTAMGTTLGITVEAADRASALAAGEAAVAALAAVEGRLSTWRRDTELARLNGAPAGEPVSLSPATVAELEAARQCWRDTGGAFDPGVGALVAAWGLRGGGRVPAARELRRALAAGGLDRLELDPGAGTAVRRHEGLRLEEGGFGKGAGLAAAAGALCADPAVRRALVDLGGQLVMVGRGPFRVEVADPGGRRGPLGAGTPALLTLTLDGGSLATSGNGERGIAVDGRRYGHLLDPASGRPVADFGSVTVWTADPLRADCLSTALYVMGPGRALAWAAAAPGVEALVVETGGDAPRVRATAGLARRAVAAAGVVVETYREKSFEQHRPATRPDHKRRTAVAVPWEGRTAARENPASPRGGARFHKEYR